MVAHILSLCRGVSNVAVVCMPDENIIVIGGTEYGSQCPDDIQVYDAKHKKWTLSSLSTARILEDLIDCRAEILIFPYKI